MPSNKVTVKVYLTVLPKTGDEFVDLTSRPRRTPITPRTGTPTKNILTRNIGRVYLISALVILSFLFGYLLNGVILSFFGPHYAQINYGQTVTGSTHDLYGNQWQFNGTKGDIVSVKVTTNSPPVNVFQVYFLNNAEVMDCVIDGVKNNTHCEMDNVTLLTTGKYEIDVQNHSQPATDIPYNLTVTKNN